jgi:hypothetical protein
MKKNLLAIFEELAKVNAMQSEAREEKETLESKLYNLIDRNIPIKERIEARKNLESTINYLNGEVLKKRERIEFLNMFSIALKAEALKEAKVIIAQNFIDNFAKVDGVPARYKKVKSFIDCFECYNIGAHYSEFYETIAVYIKGEGSTEEHLYITKKVGGEAVIDIERCKHYADETLRTPQDIEENIERFISAKKELEKAANEYAEKVAAIKDGCYCLGLNFDGRY